MTSKLETALFTRYKEHVLAGRLTARQSFWLLLLMDELVLSPDSTFADEVELMIHHGEIGRHCLQDMTVREAAARIGLSKSTFFRQTQIEENLPAWDKEGCVIDSENPVPLVPNEPIGVLEVCNRQKLLSQAEPNPL